MDTFARILYQKFLLRDVVGKIAPGGVAVLAVMQNLERLQSGGVIFAFVALGVFFLLGLALQVVGELIGLLSASPKPHHVLLLPVGWLRRLPPCALWWQINEDSAERLVRIRCATSEQIGAEALAHWEYLSALREGTGTLAMALLVAVSGCVIASEAVSVAIVVTLLWSAWLLWSAQSLFAKRQARFEIILLARAELLSAEETLAMSRVMGLREEQIPIMKILKRGDTDAAGT